MKLLKLVPDHTNVDFMRWRNLAVVLSTLLTVASLAYTAYRGLNLGVDFVGGQLIRVTFAQPIDVEQLRGRVDAGESVSGKVSEELAQNSAIAIALAMLGIAIYIWFRFEWQFGVGALVTLFHDVAMTLGFFSLTQLQVDLNVVAAILTIVGYSLNDTVVIYDRIRENLRKYRKMEIVPLLNLSLNETLSRTMVTSLSILLALLALVLIGPDVIFGLTIAIFIGIFVGTYSSIYISSPILVWLGVTTGSFLPKDPVSRAERGPRNEGYDGAQV